MTRPAVTFVVPRYLPRLGGIETHVSEVAARLRRRSWDARVLTQEHELRTPIDRLDPFGTPVRVNPGTRDLLGQGVSRHTWQDVRRQWDGPGILHLQNFHALSTLLVSAQPWREPRHSPTLLTPHYLGVTATGRAALHATYRRLFSRVIPAFSAVVCVSDSEADLLASEQWVPRELITVIPNGVDHDTFHHADAHDFDHRAIIAAGRLVAYKGHGRLVDALADLPSDVHLHLVGEGPDAASFEQRARDLGVQSRLHLHGRQPPARLAELMTGASVVASLSERECFGMTLLEGIATGANVVASDIPPHRDVAALAPGANLALLHLDSSREAVAAELARALDAPRAAPASVATPSWDEVAERHDELYLRLSESGGRTP